MSARPLRFALPNSPDAPDWGIEVEGIVAGLASKIRGYLKPDLLMEAISENSDSPALLRLLCSSDDIALCREFQGLIAGYVADRMLTCEGIATDPLLLKTLRSEVLQELRS